MKSRVLVWAAAGLLTVSTGCQWCQSLFGSPGTVRQQQLQATFHDPYADNDLGPEIVGGRPRDFAKPLV